MLRTANNVDYLEYNPKILTYTIQKLGSASFFWNKTIDKKDNCDFLSQNSYFLAVTSLFHNSDFSLRILSLYLIIQTF